MFSPYEHYEAASGSILGLPMFSCVATGGPWKFKKRKTLTIFIRKGLILLEPAWRLELQTY